MAKRNGHKGNHFVLTRISYKRQNKVVFFLTECWFSKKELLGAIVVFAISKYYLSKESY